MACFALLALTPPARAQSNGGGHYWQITYSGSGTNVEDYLPYSGSNTSDQLTNSWYTYPNATSVTSYLSPGPSGLDVSLSGTGTATATLTWVPYNGETIAQDPPPTKVYLKVSSEAGWTASYQGQGVADMSAAVADDGQGDSAVSSGTNGSSSSNHLIQCDGSSGTIVITRTLTAKSPPSSYTVTSSYGYYTQGFWNWIYTTGWVSFAVAQDPRSVIISSPTIEPSYAKAYDANGNVIQKLWPRNSDGSMYVDSAMSWGNVHNDAQWQAVDTFTANAVNFTNPTYAWSGSFDPVFNYGEDMNKPTITVQHDFGVDVTTPQTREVQVSVTDGPGTDGAIGTNTYTVTWHLPYQVTEVLPSVSGKYAFETRVSGVDQSNFAVVKDSPAGELPLDALIDGTSEVAAAAGSEGAAGLLKILGTLAKITDWKYPYQEEPETATGNRNDGTSWSFATNLEENSPSGPDWPENVPVDLVNNPNGWMQCQMALKRVAYYTWQYWQADEYDTNGFNSPNHLLSAYTITSDHDEPFFTKATY